MYLPSLPGKLLLIVLETPTQMPPHLLWEVQLCGKVGHSILGPLAAYSSVWHSNYLTL